ncbi:MAG: YwbE family protein, partial [Nitrosopumilus sp. H8]
MVDLPTRSQIRRGTFVGIETKIDQGTGKLTNGIAEIILTSSEIHPYGIKVRLEDGRIGRVKRIL